jgi:hypothetical protein
MSRIQRRAITRWVRSAVLFATIVVTCGCAELLGVASEGARPVAPVVDAVELRVVELPTARGLAAFYCERLLGPLICSAFGSAERPRFVFDLELAITNQSPAPMPMVQALVAFQAYPDANDPTSLGTTCVSLCGEPSECPAEGPEACVSDDPLVHDRASFVNAAAGFLVGVATGVVDPRNVSVAMIPAGSTLRTVVRLTLDAPTMLEVMTRLGRDVSDELRTGQVPAFEIPYAVQGAVWVEVSGFGRMGVNFGPARGEFRVGDVATR